MEIVNCVCYIECRNSNANQMLSLFLLLTFDPILLANVGYNSYIFSSGFTEQVKYLSFFCQFFMIFHIFVLLFCQILVIVVVVPVALVVELY